MLCPRCGAKNDDDVNFCSSCGASQERIETDDTQSIPSVAAGEITPLGTPAVMPERTSDVLVVNSGPSIGARFEVGSDAVSVGRSVASDIFLDDVTVSRSHARFLRTDSGRLAVQDAGSLNGTYVNHVRVDEKILDSGDEIQIGKFKLIFLAARS